jgi:hypothetical protein
MPLRRRLPDQWRITIPYEHDDSSTQALLVKLESCLTLPIEAEIWIQSHLQRLATQFLTSGLGVDLVMESLRSELTQAASTPNVNGLNGRPGHP